MTEHSKIIETVLSVEALASDLSITYHHTTDPETSTPSVTNIFMRSGDANSSNGNSAQLDLRLWPDGYSNTYVTLRTALDTEQYTQIYYWLEDGTVSRTEQLKTTRMSDIRKQGDPFAVGKSIETTRNATKYSARALARLVAIKIRHDAETEV